MAFANDEDRRAYHRKYYQEKRNEGFYKRNFCVIYFGVCEVCKKWFSAKKASKKTCSDICSKELKRRTSAKHYQESPEYYVNKSKKRAKEKPKEVAESKKKWLTLNRERVNKLNRERLAKNPGLQKKYTETYILKDPEKFKANHAENERFRRARLELGNDAPPVLIDLRVMVARVRGAAIAANGTGRP